MAEFINPDDYDASIHREILDSIIRKDEAVLEICEAHAMTARRYSLQGERTGTRSYSCSP